MIKREICHHYLGNNNYSQFRKPSRLFLVKSYVMQANNFKLAKGHLFINLMVHF